MALRIISVLIMLYAGKAIAGQACHSEVRKFGEEPYYSGGQCYCGKSLESIKATLPPSLKIVAACGFVDWKYGPRRIINLTNEKISFDDYDADGNIPYGDLYVSGKSKLKIEILDIPIPEDSEWRATATVITKIIDSRYKPLHAIFQSIDIGNLYGKIPVKKPKNSLCYKINADVEYNGFILKFGDHDSSGLYGLEPKILSVNDTASVKCPTY